MSKKNKQERLAKIAAGEELVDQDAGAPLDQDAGAPVDQDAGATVDQVKAPFGLTMDAGASTAPVKRKRGRQPGFKVNKAEPVAVEIKPELLRPLVDGLTGALERRYGSAFRYDDGARSTIATLLTAVVNKHAPAMVTRYGEEFALLTYLALDTYSRMMDAQKLKAEQSISKDKKAPAVE